MSVERPRFGHGAGVVVVNLIPCEFAGDDAETDWLTPPGDVHSKG